MVSVKTEITDGIGIIRVSDTPYHFMTAEMVKQLDVNIRKWGKDENVRAIIITNQIPGYFITHYSLAEIANGGKIINKYPFINKKNFAGILWKLMRIINFMSRIPIIGNAFLQLLDKTELGNGVISMNRMNELYNYVERMPKPVIAAIGGNCMGGGMEFALSCDFRIMARGDYHMGLIEILIGIIPGGGGTQRLLKMIGVAKTKEMVLTGQRVKADEAARIGIVTKVVEEEILMDEAMAFARYVSKNSPIGIKYAKESIIKGQHLPVSKAVKPDVTGFLTAVGEDRAMQSFEDYENKIKTGLESHIIYDEMDNYQ